MKSIATLLFCTCFSLLVLSSCADSTTTNTPSDKVLSLDSLKGLVAKSTWIVSKYSEKSVNKLSFLDAVTITFEENGDLSAIDTKSNTGATGRWFYTPGPTTYGSSSMALLTLSLGTSTPWTQLSRKWNVLSAEAGVISLEGQEASDQVRMELQMQL